MNECEEVRHVVVKVNGMEITRALIAAAVIRHDVKTVEAPREPRE
jgi:DNA-binding protein